MDHRVTLVSTGRFGTKGERYEAWLLRDGAAKELVYTGWEPIYATCRELQARGLTGWVQFWRHGCSNWDMRANIERAATRTVSENEKTGPRVVKFVPNPRFDQAEDHAA